MFFNLDNCLHEIRQEEMRRKIAIFKGVGDKPLKISEAQKIKYHIKDIYFLSVKDNNGKYKSMAVVVFKKFIQAKAARKLLPGQAILIGFAKSDDVLDWWIDQCTKSLQLEYSIAFGCSPITIIKNGITQKKYGTLLKKEGLHDFCVDDFLFLYKKNQFKFIPSYCTFYLQNDGLKELNENLQKYFECKKSEYCMILEVEGPHAIACSVNPLKKLVTVYDPERCDVKDEGLLVAKKIFPNINFIVKQDLGIMQEDKISCQAYSAYWIYKKIMKDEAISFINPQHFRKYMKHILNKFYN